MARTPKPLRPNPEIINSSPYTWRNDVSGQPLELVAKSYEFFRRSWTGTRTPNFITYKDLGKLPENATTSDITWDNNGAAKDYRVKVTAVQPFPQWAKVDGVTRDIVSWVSAPQANHLLAARVKAITQLRSRVSNSGGLAVDLGEINQTVSMIATNVTRIVHAARAIRRGNFKGAFSALGIVPSRSFNPINVPTPKRERDQFKLLANYWLEYTYGWKPLVQDVHDSIEALEKFFEKNQWVIGVPASAKDFNRSVLDVSMGPYPWVPAGKENHTVTSKSKFKVYYKRDDHVKILLAELGLTNPLDLAWELLPFSFVVDWFYPIGPWLEALHAFDGLVFVKGTEIQLTTETANVDIARSFKDHDAGSPFWQIDQFGSRESTRIRFSRTPLSGFPATNAPIPKSPVSVQHAANALALLVAIFK